MHVNTPESELLITDGLQTFNRRREGVFRLIKHIWRIKTVNLLHIFNLFPEVGSRNDICSRSFTKTQENITALEVNNRDMY